MFFVSLIRCTCVWVGFERQEPRGRLACETGVSDFGSESSKYVPTEYCCVLNSVQLYSIQRYGNGQGVTSIYIRYD